MKTIRNFASLFMIGTALTVSASGAPPQIHPDCMTSQTPVLCTSIVDQLLNELGYFNQVFLAPDASSAAAAADFYHEDAVLYTKASDLFYVGRTSIERDYFAPFLSVVKTARVNFEALHFMVVNPEMVIVYGRPTASLTLLDGTMLTQPPLPQTLTFVRNPRHDPKRPFVIVADQE